ncbi:MAG: hypothetical protein IPM92_16995, partial [Saprospiraceae bacterium]|nr:hypothetical protein [Saprospiraceae bacterium]
HMDESLKSNSNVLFVNANALIATGKGREACTIFEIVKSDPKSRYNKVAATYYEQCSKILQSKQ